MAKYSSAQNRATQKYIHGNYDQVVVRIRKDAEINREVITAASKSAGMSLNGYIMEAIKEKMTRDGCA